MKFYVLASGSKGNCTVIKGTKSTIMIDCGCSKKYITEHLNKVGIDNIDALFITHSHSDHTKSINCFSNYQIYCPYHIDLPFTIVRPLQIIKYNEFTILPIPLSHDTDITVGYIIFDGQETLVSLTDTGYVSVSNEKLIKDAEYYIFESNYDVDMLMESQRTQYLKMRIVSDCGHMDNNDSSEILSRIITNKTKEIVLAHISQECNKPEIAYNTLVNKLKEKQIDYSNIKITCASQTEMYEGGK